MFLRCTYLVLLAAAAVAQTNSSAPADSTAPAATSSASPGNSTAPAGNSTEPAGNATSPASNSTGPYWHSFINDTIANATLWPKAETIAFNKVSLAGWRSNEVRGVSPAVQLELILGCRLVCKPHC